jgi:hypothetical protein
VPTIEVAEVLSAQANELFEYRIWSDVEETIPHAEHRKFHIRRIATLLAQNNNELPALILENHTADIKAYFYDGDHRVATEVRTFVTKACSLAAIFRLIFHRRARKRV